MVGFLTDAFFELIIVTGSFVNWVLRAGEIGTSSNSSGTIMIKKKWAMNNS